MNTETLYMLTTTSIHAVRRLLIELQRYTYNCTDNQFVGIIRKRYKFYLNDCGLLCKRCDSEVKRVAFCKMKGRKIFIESGEALSRLWLYDFVEFITLQFVIL